MRVPAVRGGAGTHERLLSFLEELDESPVVVAPAPSKAQAQERWQVLRTPPDLADNHLLLLQGRHGSYAPVGQHGRAGRRAGQGGRRLGLRSRGPNPAAFEPNLARSLNNLSIRLADGGRRDEGLAAIEEAVAIYRRPADANRAAYESDLANSLNNFADRLSALDRHKDATEAAAEAEAISRRLLNRR